MNSEKYVDVTSPAFLFKTREGQAILHMEASLNPIASGLFWYRDDCLPLFESRFSNRVVRDFNNLIEAFIQLQETLAEEEQRLSSQSMKAGETP